LAGVNAAPMAHEQPRFQPLHPSEQACSFLIRYSKTNRGPNPSRFVLAGHSGIYYPPANENAATYQRPDSGLRVGVRDPEVLILRAVP